LNIGGGAQVIERSEPGVMVEGRRTTE
jgi:hypothetical protein